MNMSQMASIIVIPCCNEEKFIGKCLDSIIAHEVSVVDGMSEDGTRTILG